jgi:hypothetical protein
VPRLRPAFFHALTWFAKVIAPLERFDWRMLMYCSKVEDWLTIDGWLTCWCL